MAMAIGGRAEQPGGPGHGLQPGLGGRGCGYGHGGGRGAGLGGKWRRGAEITRKAAAGIQADLGAQQPARRRAARLAGAGLHQHIVQGQVLVQTFLQRGAGTAVHQGKALPQRLRGGHAHPAGTGRHLRRLPAHQMVLGIGLPLPVRLQLRQQLRMLARLAQGLGEARAGQAHRHMPGGGHRAQQQRHAADQADHQQPRAALFMAQVDAQAQQQQARQPHRQQPRAAPAGAAVGGGFAGTIHVSHCKDHSSSPAACRSRRVDPHDLTPPVHLQGQA